MGGYGGIKDLGFYNWHRRLLANRSSGWTSGLNIDMCIYTLPLESSGFIPGFVLWYPETA